MSHINITSQVHMILKYIYIYIYIYVISPHQHYSHTYIHTPYNIPVSIVSSICFQTFYKIIIILGLLFVTVLPVLVRLSSPGNKETRYQWLQYDSSRKCWNQLIDGNVTTSVYDITDPTTHGFIILLSVFSVVAAYKQKNIMIVNAGCILIITLEVLMLFTYQMAVQYKESHGVPYLSRISEEVHNQLQISKDEYNKDYPDIKRSWDNTLKDGCFCGVDSYKDFLEHRNQIPEYCKCTLPGPSGSRRYSYPTCSDNADISYDNVSEYNVTSRGCFRYIIGHIQHDNKQIHVVKMITFMSVTTVQLALFLLAKVFKFCSSSASDSLEEPDEANEYSSSDAA